MSDLVVGEVRGYRVWTLSSDGYLGAISSTHLWISATEEATCRLSENPYGYVDHPAPFTDCSCGLYAYYRPTTVRPSAEEVFGVVAVAGRVILATRGMKAERMTILGLVTDDAALGDRYGVPIFKTRGALLSVYPPQGYHDLVDVDPSDSPAFGVSSPVPARKNPSGFGVRKKRTAEAIAVLAAQAGVTTAEVAGVLQYLPKKDRAKVMADALALSRTGDTVPRWRRFRRDSARR